MATWNIAAGDFAKHDVTLTAATVETFVFADNIGRVRIIWDGAAKGYYTVDGSTPTVAGAKCLPLPAVPLESIEDMKAGDTLKIISAGTPTVSVIGL